MQETKSKDASFLWNYKTEQCIIVVMTCKRLPAPNCDMRNESRSPATGLRGSLRIHTSVVRQTVVHIR